MTPDVAAIAAFIRQYLPPAPVPGIAELSLHRATPSSGLARLLGAVSEPPYWAYRWSGGLALARHVLDHPETVAGRRVLDLGAGSGLVGIAAAKAGAASVVAAEIDRHAVVALALNAALNGVSVSIVHEDVTVAAPPPVDIVLVGDLFYAVDLATRVTYFLDRCLAAGIEVLIGDPGRVHLPHERLKRLSDHLVAETDGPAQASAVFAFGPAAR